MISFGMVLLIGFLLLVSLVIATITARLTAYVAGSMADMQRLLWGSQFLASLGIESLLFASIFRVLPDRVVRWSDVWVGAIATALLFEVGKSAIGLFLGNTLIGSLYGAAGSFVVILLWVYYSSQILFLGAEFTWVWSQQQERTSSEHGV